MRLHPGLVSTFVVLSGLAATAGPAHAAGVAYIQTEPGKSYGQVVVASLDGQTKVQLSPTPTDPPDERWLDVAQGDGGQIIGVRNVPGRQGQFATFAIWQPDGTLTDQGPLQNISGYSVNVLPLSVDITPDGKSMVYGYSNSRFTTQYEFAQGFVPQSVATRSSGTPLNTSGQEWPTLAGRRVVSISGGTISVQDDATSNPYAGTFTPWLSVPAPYTGRRTDVAANGRVAAVELYSGDVERIGMFPITGLGGAISPVDHDCFLPTAGNGKEVSLLQDGTRVAYVDDGGVRVAPVTDFAGLVTDCAPTTPVTIDPAGRHPSLGPIDVVAIKNARTPPPPPPPATTPGGTTTTPGGTTTTPGGTTTTPGGTLPTTDPQPAAKAPTVTVAASAKAATLGTPAGDPVTVSVAKAGKVTLALTVSSKTLGQAGKAKTIVLATGTGTAKARGRLSVKLKATAAGRRVLKKLKGKTLRLRITFGGRTTTKTVKLR
jgi:hypothetical protein